MGKLRQPKRVTTLVPREKSLSLAALLLEREAARRPWPSKARAAAVRALRLLVMMLSLATLVGIAVIGYAVVR